MNNYSRDLLKRIEKKDFEIAVVGLGYVGLPLAIEFANKGVKVLGIEIDKGRIEHLKRKESYITDVPTADLKKVLRSGKFRAFSDFLALKHSDVIIICVPTPLKRKYHPNITYIEQAVRSISRHLKKGSLVILESTTYPGTTEEVILPLLESANRKHNNDFFLSFSPERIDPGNKDFPVHKIPKVVGGLSKEATLLAAAVYKTIIDKVVTVSDSTTAEAVKLLENTYRLINIGLIDEMAMMAHEMKIDIWEVVHAAATKPFGFMPFYPGPGVGGHCIPKDPLYLYWKAKHFGFKSRFIKLASDIISFMPKYVANRVEAVLKKRGIELKNAKILVVGVTYKKDIKDLRKSPSIDIIKVLKDREVCVEYFDPLIPYLKMEHINLRSIMLDKKTVEGFDCVIIATDHSAVNYAFLAKNAKLIFDTRNIYKKANERIIKL